MCGINFYYIKKERKVDEVVNCSLKSLHRGPDITTIKVEELNDYKTVCVFHRLSINDVKYGNQPFFHPISNKLYMVCNGEIYNWKELAKIYHINTHSKSDCEIIVHLYYLIGFTSMITKLDGYFSIVIVDMEKKQIHIGRDRFGVRSLYVGVNKKKGIEEEFGFSSEMKSLVGIYKDIQQFEPGTYKTIYIDRNLLQTTKYFDVKYDLVSSLKNESQYEICRDINLLLRKAVNKRMLVDSQNMIGCLLSGGLDSSLITALVSENFSNKKDLNTFSIGLKDSVDLKYAQIVAKYLGTTHHEIVVSEVDMLNVIYDVIKQIETFDTTTIRASIPMYLLSKYIREKTDVKVVFSGEGSDEASGSYLYFHKCPNAEEFNKECIRLLKELHYFDLLRSDKSTSSSGLELRAPFMDFEFLKYYMSISSEIKMPKTWGIEKYLLRKSFENLLPKEIIYRVKEAFSDGVSNQTNSWFNIIQNYVDKKVSDDYFNKRISEMNSKNMKNIPKMKESLYYYDIYESIYGTFDNYNTVIPYYWLPKWVGDVNDPSARILNIKPDKNSNELK